MSRQSWGRSRSGSCYGATGGGHGAEGAAVEAHGGGDDMIAAGTVFLDAVFTGHFDHCFVCLGAGVLEKDFVHTDAGADLLGQ